MVLRHQRVQPSPPARDPALALALALLAVLMVLAGTATAQSTAAALAPEEAIVSLLPYRVAQPDLPPGYRAGASDALVPSIQAAQSDDPAHTLDTLTGQGYVVGFHQAIEPARGSASPNAELIVYLMADAASARAYTTDLSRQPAMTAASHVDPVTPGVTAGDASLTWHLALTLPQGESAGGYEVRWQRGQLVLMVLTVTHPGQEQLGDAQALVAAVDKKAATAGPPALAAPTVAPAAGEAQRLDAAQSLTALLLPPGDVPGDWYTVDSRLVHPASLVFNAPDPGQALADLDQRFRRVMSVEQEFLLGLGAETPTAGVYANLDADAASAALDLNTSGDPAAAVTPPLSLGDQTVAFEYHPTRSDGSTADDLDVYWSHGPVILNVEMEDAAGALDLNSFAAFMSKLEAAYQASGYATPPGAPAGLRATALDAASIRLDWTDPDALADGYVIVSADGGRVTGQTGRNASTFTVTGLQPGTSYCFQVYGYDPAGSSPLSASACATTRGQ